MSKDEAKWRTPARKTCPMLPLVFDRGFTLGIESPNENASRKGTARMGEFYCPKCADECGKRREWWKSVDPLDSEYQKDKHEKHTSASTSYEFQSVFDESKEEYYRQSVREALQNGAIEETQRGTKAVYCPSTQSDIGSAYNRTNLIDRRDTVVVVKSTESQKVHAMVGASSKFVSRTCTSCGNQPFRSP